MSARARAADEPLARAARPLAEPRCIVCGAPAGREVCHKNGYSLLLCRCGCAYLSPAPADDAVDPTLDAHPDSFYARPAALKVRWLARARPAGSLLEIGCGEGHFLAAAQAHGYRIAGVEPHPARAARASARLGIEVERAFLDSTAAPPGSFDLVYHCDLLSHFADPEAALRRMKALLRRGGALFFEIGLHGEIDTFWYQRMPEHTFPRHRWLYSEPGLEKLLARAGLRITDRRRFGLAPQVVLYASLGSARRLVRSALRRSHPRASPPRPPRAETALEAWLNDALRFHVGAIAPDTGPQTLFVLAEPER